MPRRPAASASSLALLVAAPLLGSGSALAQEPQWCDPGLACCAGVVDGEIAVRVPERRKELWAVPTPAALQGAGVLHGVLHPDCEHLVLVVEQEGRVQLWVLDSGGGLHQEPIGAATEVEHLGGLTGDGGYILELSAGRKLTFDARTGLLLQRESLLPYVLSGIADWTFPEGSHGWVPRSIDGRVEFPDGSPAVGAEIIVESGTRFIARTFTKEDGRFGLAGDLWPDEPVRVTARLEGLGWAEIGPHPKGHRLQLGVVDTSRIPLPRSVQGCDAGPLRPLIEPFAPGTCLGMTPAEVAALPLGMRYSPYDPAYTVFRIEGPRYSSVDLMLRGGQEHPVVTSFDVRVEGGWEGGVKAQLGRWTATLDDILGPHQEEVRHTPALPHGDSYCGTPVPASTVIRREWRSTALGVEARVQTVQVEGHYSHVDLDLDAIIE